MYVVPSSDHSPADTDPCSVVPGFRWVHVYPTNPTQQPDWTGKWVIQMNCPYVAHSWGLIRDATAAGLLGIGAKIGTQWGMQNDPAKKWKQHVVCVYTYDWHDAVDVLRVGSRLHSIGVMKTGNISYKPDVFTEAGMYQGNADGEVAIYGIKPPYEELKVFADNYDKADSLFMIMPDGSRARLVQAKPR